MDFKKLLIRSLSGLVYVAVIVGCCIGSLVGVSVLAVVFATLATIEFARICSEGSERNMPVMLIDIVSVVCLTLGVYIFTLPIWLFLIIARFVLELYTENGDHLRNLAHSAMVQIYIGLPLACMVALPFFVHGAGENVIPGAAWLHDLFGNVAYCWPLLLVTFFMIWINDTGAFLVGSMMGRHKLFERISPKKTWEGFFGGLLFNLGASLLFCYHGGTLFPHQDNVGFWLGMAAVVTIFGTWGDLVESLIKRTLHIKGSGNLIPGHGGVLDRFDALLLSAPYVFLYLLLVGRFV